MKPLNPPSALPDGDILRFSAGSDPDARARLDVERLAAAPLRPLHDGHRVPGWLQELPWESAHLGAPCFNLWIASDPEDPREIARLASHFPRHAFIWTRVASEHHRARESLVAAGFEPILEMLNFERPLSQAPRLSPNPRVRHGWSPSSVEEHATPSRHFGLRPRPRRRRRRRPPSLRDRADFPRARNTER